jgi:uncharacterized protein YjbI with pentapeptide repeats
VSEQDGHQTAAPQRPVTDGRGLWKAYWEAQGQPWRTEPEIDVGRQKYLAERRAIMTDVLTGIYPFKGVGLSRADIEWLLATHDNGRGPVDWTSESQPDPYFARKGLDFRGADLRGMDLRELPLARLIGGDLGEFGPKTDAQHEMEAIHLEGATLLFTHLEGAVLSHSHLEGANLYGAFLERALLICTHLEEAMLDTARLEEAKLWDAHLEKARLNANFERAQLSEARLDGANLSSANLKRANLYGTHLEGADLTLAHLEGAHLFKAFFDGETNLTKVRTNDDKHGAFYLADIHWGDVNVAVVDWQAVSVLGDEPIAEKWRPFHRRPKPKKNLVKNYQKAVRAYRQVAIVLRNQGLNEDAARFAYRAQLMQRAILREQRKRGQYLFSLFLDLLAGYGYKPWRSFVAYLLVIAAFATTYFFIGQTVGPALSPLGAWVFSMTSFHGRGFFPGGITLDDPLTVVAALEAFVGLLIEVTFIATLTQRLFGK